MKYQRERLLITVDYCQKEGVSKGHPFLFYRGAIESLLLRGTEGDSNLVNETIESAKFQIHKIQTGIDKNKWIIKKRKKTNIVSKIPLLDAPANIIKKYKDYPRTSNLTALLPVPSNQKMNAYLKEIGNIAKINKILTTHDGRRDGLGHLTVYSKDYVLEYEGTVFIYELCVKSKF